MGALRLYWMDRPGPRKSHLDWRYARQIQNSLSLTKVFFLLIFRSKITQRIGGSYSGGKHSRYLCLGWIWWLLQVRSPQIGLPWRPDSKLPMARNAWEVGSWKILSCVIVSSGVLWHLQLNNKKYFDFKILLILKSWTINESLNLFLIHDKYFLRISILTCWDLSQFALFWMSNSCPKIQLWQNF